MSRDIQIGDWIVFFDYRYHATGPVSSFTAKTFTAPYFKGGVGPARQSIGKVIFFGTEAEAEMLGARLQSSLALATDEQRTAKARHSARAADLVKKAAADRDELAREGSASGMNPKGGPA